MKFRFLPFKLDFFFLKFDIFLQKLFSFVLQFSIFVLKFQNFRLKILSKFLITCRHILQFIGGKTFLLTYCLDFNSRQAKSSKCCLHFCNSDSEVCTRELTFCHVSEVFISKLPEIINISFDQWTQSMSDRIREQNGIKEHSTVPLRPVSIYHCGQQSGMSSLISWRLTVFKVQAILRRVLPFSKCYLVMIVPFLLEQ